jgi:ferritin-like metal-binding protein YciE
LQVDRHVNKARDREPYDRVTHVSLNLLESVVEKGEHIRDVAAAFTKHERETQGQVTRLDKIFKIIGKPARGKTCDAINGITDEGAEIMKEFKGAPALDAGLLASAQAVEHYEISRYGTLRTWAEELGFDDAAQLLEATLEEEKNTDKALTALAKSVVNAEAEEEEA